MTELAASQALAQPTVTQLVGRLGGARPAPAEAGPRPEDGRVVLVSSTPAAAPRWTGCAVSTGRLLRDQLAGHSDEDVLALAAATELIQEIIDALQRDVP